MGLRIKTNMESLVAQRRLTESRRSLGDSLERMSSGMRINKSADDAAGLAVSERMRATTRSLDVAKRNASDGISYVQVAEGALNEVTNITVRLRELAAQAASDTIGNRERGFLDKEFQQLRKEMARIVESTEFNGTKVLNAEEMKPLKIFVGSSNRANDVDGNAPEIDEENDPDTVTIDLADLSSLREALSSVTDEEGLAVVPEDPDGGATELGSTGTNDLLNRLDTTLNAVAGYRSTLGSVQARLNSTITNIEVSNENISAAMSRIRDVDYAAETARYAQNRILTQAGISVLAQANQTPDFVLQLIRSA